MRLSFLSDSVYPFHPGGKETLHYERSIRLARRGHAVRILTMHGWPTRQRSMARDGVVFQSVAPRTPLYTRNGGRSIWGSVIFGLGSLRLLWSPDFDVLDVDQLPLTPFFAARLVCWLRGRPMTATWHEVWDRDDWREPMGRFGPIGFWLQRYAAQSADLIYANSRLTARRLVELLGVDPRLIIVVPPGVVVPSPACGGGQGGGQGGGHGWGTKTIDCIFVGRLVAHQHVDVFLRALALAPGVTGLIIGTGPEKDRLIALAAELRISDRVRFEPHTSHEIVLERLHSARLLVFPSTREGFGVAVLEANACGVPALVVQHPDNAALELVRDGVTGIICDLAPHPIAANIRAYLADPPLQSRMGKAARATAASYSWDAYVNKMEAALKSLVGEMPSPLADQKAA
jgi:glycosyltransferase involved in cell wall biosynthesis